MKYGIYHTDDYNGFKADFLMSDKTVTERKNCGIFNGYELVCEVKPTKEAGLNFNGFAYRVYESADGRRFQVFAADYSAKEMS